MDLNETVDGRDRPVRILLTVALLAYAVRSFRKGKRVTGALAGLGALGLGYTLTTETKELTEVIDIETGEEDDQLRCAECGDPIVPGERRKPNADNEVVHETCLETSA